MPAVVTLLELPLVARDITVHMEPLTIKQAIGEFTHVFGAIREGACAMAMHLIAIGVVCSLVCDIKLPIVGYYHLQ